MAPTSGSAAAPVSLRERKKHKTRSQLIAVSQRLFAEQGYSDTTLEQICVEVEVHPQTLLRYFDSKAHLALAPLYDIYEGLRTRLLDPDRTDSAVAIWRSHVESESLRHSKHLAAFSARVQAEPVLRAMRDELTTRYEDLLAEAIAVDGDTDPGDLYNVLLGTTLIRGNFATARRWMAAGALPDKLAAHQVGVVDFILATFPAPDSAEVATLVSLQPSRRRRRS